MQSLAHSRHSAEGSYCYLPTLLSSGFDPNQAPLMHIRRVALSSHLELPRRQNGTIHGTMSVHACTARSLFSKCLNDRRTCQVNIYPPECAKQTTGLCHSVKGQKECHLKRKIQVRSPFFPLLSKVLQERTLKTDTELKRTKAIPQLRVNYK